MLWYWVDRYTEFRRGESARAVKVVTNAERHVMDQYPESPRFPQSLVMEGLAQIAGELVSDSLDHQKMVIMAKIVRAEFFVDAVPGDRLEYCATILQLDDRGSRVLVTSTLKAASETDEGDRAQAEAELVFAHLDHGSPTGGAEEIRFSPDVLKEWMERANAFRIENDAPPQ